ncbi:MAG: hypothetical protein A3K06_00230 [Candidatus Doudnabacteria bacterium RIFCSPHIGHO2_01_52_17]|uniref:TVP38/TMEM64 family membrane protein n=1 Tax=Candidatus Doudnabacteria bacterium RIFCSPHIGHO2_01_52_17 TaxID=1817820 RepID=A0A1F5NEW9_9BACT|nr:MAG: hypothetical protein A3K06_00230 [Candidatus Doudnabacteria bacterium RIFCSPHIGHO2_01_52_17]
MSVIFKKLTKVNLFWLGAGTLLAVFFLLPLVSRDYQEYAVGLIQAYPYLAPLLIVVFRFVGMVLAPLPGAPIAFASMALLPWHEAWFYNFLGNEAGVIAAFFIARKFREPVVAHFAPLEKIHRWQERVSAHKQFWAFTGLRVVSVLAFDFVSYAAGLTKLSFKTFISATLLVDIPIGLLFFYLGGVAVKYSILFFGAFAVILVVGALILKTVPAVTGGNGKSVE